MDEPFEKNLIKIIAGTQSFFLLVKYSSSEAVVFDITVTNSINAWTGQLDKNILKELCSEVDEDLKKFIGETKKALMKNERDDGQRFEYQVKTLRDGGVKLSWKQVLEESKIKFQLGSVELTAADDPSGHIQALLQHSIDQNISQLNRIGVLEAENVRLSAERRQALQKYERCIKQKEQVEEDLYSKFCIILNEKKAKIRQLKANGPAVEDVPSTSRPQPDEEEEERMEDDDVSTDEEKEVVKNKRKKTKETDPKPQPKDDSLILSDDAETTASNKGKRRRRQPVPKVESTPSKPSIPRIASLKKTPSTSKQSSNSSPSMRKTLSTGRRGQSADVDEANDLFDEM